MGAAVLAYSAGFMMYFGYCCTGIVFLICWWWLNGVFGCNTLDSVETWFSINEGEHVGNLLESVAYLGIALTSAD